MARTAAQIQTELDLVNAAIAEFLDKKVRSLGMPAAGRSAAFLELRDLREQRRELERDLASVAGVRPSVVRFGSPS